MPKAIILTSTALRHHHVINRLAEQLEVVGVWQEEKSFRPERYAKSEEDELVIARHFSARDRAERASFGNDRLLQLAPGSMIRHLTPGGLNEPAEAALMRNLRPDVVLVFGTGILREPILDRFPGKIISLHLGLSPYYRGSGTNFWPLVNGEPEYVGATIFLVNDSLGAGPIIAHIRPDIEASDDSHAIGNKVILAATPNLIEAVELLMSGKPVPSAAQTGAGRLYRRKDFNADAVRRMWKNFENGMIEEYLQHSQERNAEPELVVLEPAR